MAAGPDRSCHMPHRPPGAEGMDERPELEEVQVLPASLDPVVDRLVGCTARRTRQPLGLALHRKVDGTLRLPEIHRNHRPWRTQTQCLCEESFHPGSVPPTSGSGKSDSTRNATDPSLASQTSNGRRPASHCGAPLDNRAHATHLIRGALPLLRLRPTFPDTPDVHALFRLVWHRFGRISALPPQRPKAN